MMNWITYWFIEGLLIFGELFGILTGGSKDTFVKDEKWKDRHGDFE